MPKRVLCVVLALVILISLTVLSSCKKQSVIEDALGTSANVEAPSSAWNTEEETQDQLETQPETKPEAQTETQTQTQPETKPEAQTEAQTQTQPETKPEAQTEREMETQAEEQTQQPSDSNSAPLPNETIKPSSPTASSLTKESLNTTDGAALSYWLYTPENATDDMPLLIYLHGGSGKGDDLDLLLQNGFPKMLSEGALGKIPAYIAIPQVSAGMKGWMDIKNSVRDLVYYCCQTYGTDASRVSLTGHSMGGTGTWKLALTFPSLFSCIAPMSGSIATNDANISALSGMPVWAFVGSADKIVEPDSSVQFIDALKDVNSKAQITVFDGADHVSVPTLAYLDDEISIIQWLITQSR